MQAGYTFNQRYKIVRPLGEGGMANVYLAHDLILDRDVSVKLLRLDLRDDPHTKRRFQREAMAATALNDPHIVGVYDVGEDNGLQYLVMEYVEGTDLKKYINDHFPIPFQTVIDIMQQILTAVSVAHQHGIIHRDLKPQNILIDKNENIKITDFGIAVAVSQNSLTQTNTVMGSVHYLSPEQARGSIATKQSDIYSLGIILYELLTGKVPFEGETAVSIALKHFNDDMPSVREFDPRIPQDLENIVLKATAKSPSDRYKTADEMSQDLSTSLSSNRAHETRFVAQQSVNDETRVISTDKINKKIESQNVQPTDPPKNKKKRRKWPWLLLLLIVILVGAFFAFASQRVVVPDVNGLTQASAETKIKDAHLKVGKVTSKASETIKAGNVIAVSPASQHKIARNSKVKLTISTGHKKIKIGNYVGNRYSNTARKLRLKGLTVKKISVSSDDIEAGQIMAQSLKSGKKVKTHGTTITFKVSSGTKKITLPDFTNKTQDEVQDFADQNGLQLNVNEDDSKSVEAGHVISQSPGSGSRVSHGGSFTITVAKAQEKQTSVSITIPFDSSNNQTQNRVQVYIEDANHNLTQEFQDLTISQDTKISIPLTLKDGATGKYKVLRDGKTIMSADNIGG